MYISSSNQGIGKQLTAEQLKYQIKIIDDFFNLSDIKTFAHEKYLANISYFKRFGIEFIKSDSNYTVSLNKYDLDDITANVTVNIYLVNLTKNARVKTIGTANNHIKLQLAKEDFQAQLKLLEAIKKDENNN